MSPNADQILQELYVRRLVPNRPCSTYVVGSRARGWNNPRSDVDIYLVTDGPVPVETGHVFAVPLNPSRVPTASFVLDDTRWEVTYWRDTQVRQMFAKVAWHEFTRDLVAGDLLSFREELFLARLADGVAIQGGDWLDAARGALAGTAFRSFLVSRSLGRAHDTVEDALGQMESGDLESATLSARDALRHITDALLASRGEYVVSAAKWKPQRFRAAAPEVLSFERFWALDTMRSYDAADPTSWIEEVLTLCQDLSMRIGAS